MVDTERNSTLGATLGVYLYKLRETWQLSSVIVNILHPTTFQFKILLT